MRRFFRVRLQRLAAWLQGLAFAFWTSPAEVRVAKWRAAQGDATLRLDYELSERSTVFDLGGYQGQWASDIHAMYGCRVYVFEPVPAFAEQIARRFRRNPRIRVFPFGLAARSETVRLGLAQDATSTFKPGAESVEARLVGISEFLRSEGVGTIDLMKINIEGGEYDLLEHLLDEGLIARIGNLQVQFHDFVPDAEARMAAIQQRLARSHAPTYQFPFVWENWRLRT
ncbi:MAG TPA: FkbM family methyltransferase [Burkholderiales bacterium]|jgi:FkbM family methyltransferase|nr:FkbM family methyltransferase [Burkholderiales bacterium]